MAAVVLLRRALRMVKEENATSQYSIFFANFSPQRKQKSFPWLGQSVRLRSHQWKVKKREELRGREDKEAGPPFSLEHLMLGEANRNSRNEITM